MEMLFLQHLEGDKHEWHACCRYFCKAKPQTEQYLSAKDDKIQAAFRSALLLGVLCYRDNLPFIRRKRVEQNLMKISGLGPYRPVKKYMLRSMYCQTAQFY